MAELRGQLNTDVECTGDEYAEFKQCVMMGADSDPALPGWSTDLEDGEVIINRGDGRHLQASHCRGCRSGAPRGSFCFTFCRSGRRLVEEVTDTPEVRRLQEVEEDNVAVFQGAVFHSGAYTGNDEAKQVAEVIIECLGGVSENHSCLGSTETMTLIVHTSLTSADDLFNKAGCLRARKRHYK
jgi:hypothetical protein